MRKDTVGLIAIIMSVIGPYALEPFKVYWWVWSVLLLGCFILYIAFICWPSKTESTLQYIGLGGRGGNAKAFGKNSAAEGGKGGHGGTGVGGAGGGAGANHPEYDRRLKLLTKLRLEYMQAFPSDADFINAGIDQVPLNWINKRLEEMQESWQIKMENGLYKMPLLNPKQ